MRRLRQTARALLSASLPSSWWLVRGRTCAIEEPALSLSFDDGPHPEHTPRVLDALERWELRATFFVVGREAERYPQLMERIVGSGHVVGNHTWTHSEPANTSASVFLDEVARTNDLLMTWLDQPPHWMRPPKGELTLSKLRGLWQAGHGVALWNVDPRDYRMVSADDVAAWCQSYRPKQGDVVLLHDRFPFAAEIINRLGCQGRFDHWKSITLNDWLPQSRLTQLADLSPSVSATG